MAERQPGVMRCAGGHPALAADTALGWEARLRPLGIPAAAVRSLPEALDALPDMVVSAGQYRLAGSSVKVAATSRTIAATGGREFGGSVVVDDHRGLGIAWQVST